MQIALVCGIVPLSVYSLHTFPSLFLVHELDKSVLVHVFLFAVGTVPVCALRAQHHIRVYRLWRLGPRPPRHVKHGRCHHGYGARDGGVPHSGGHDSAGIFFGTKVFLEFRRDAFTRWTRHDDGGIDEFVDVRVGINGSRLTDVTIIP